MAEPRERDTQPGSDGDIARLLRLSGPRRVPDAAQVARAREAASVEWRRLARRRRWRLWARVATTAAACVLLVTLALRLYPTPAEQRARAEVATLDRTIGVVRITDRGGTRALEPGEPVHTGDRIETGTDSRGALSAGGVSIRLDRGTSVLLDAGRIELVRGAVYVDTGSAPPRVAWNVETPLAIVRHTGTQFEVRVDAAALRVRVREGAVVVFGRSQSWTSNAGEALLLEENGSVTRDAVPTSGPAWSWVSELARAFPLEGATLAAFLDWVCREQGWRWEYAGAADAVEFDGVVLHGSIGELSPEEALAAVLPAAGLAFRREGDRVIVGAAARGGEP